MCVPFRSLGTYISFPVPNFPIPSIPQASQQSRKNPSYKFQSHKFVLGPSFPLCEASTYNPVAIWRDSLRALWAGDDLPPLPLHL